METKTTQENSEAGAGLAAATGSALLRQTVNCDRECWVKDRILTAMRMALAVKREQRVRADDDLTDCALEGIANGAAVEIIHTLGMEPEYVNLDRPPRYAVVAVNTPNNQSEP